MDHYRIGEIARLAGIPAGTIRFYERAGLLPAAHRSPNGYRIYTSAAVNRLRLLSHIRELGFSLDEARELLDSLDNGGGNCRTDCPGHRCRVASKLRDIEARIGELQRIRDTLHTVLNKDKRGTETYRCKLLATLALAAGIVAGAGNG